MQAPTELPCVYVALGGQENANINSFTDCCTVNKLLSSASREEHFNNINNVSVMALNCDCNFLQLLDETKWSS